MKLYCPMCGRIAIDSSWNFGEAVTVCGCAAVIRFQAATDGRGRRSCVIVASEAAVEPPDLYTDHPEQYSLKQSHDGALARGCGFTSVKPAREKTWRDRAIEEPLL